MEPRVYTVIETDQGDDVELHFEWYGSRTVNVVKVTDNRTYNDMVDTFRFAEQPTQAQVIEACEKYFD